MADDLEERILKANLTAMTAALTGVHVERPPGTHLEISSDDYPAVSLRKKPKVTGRHLRGAEEIFVTVEAICIVAGDGADPSGALSYLRSRIKAAVLANATWGGLASDTEVVEDHEHETEVVRGEKTGVVSWQIHAYADLEDPSQVKAI